ncbi:site-specific integrase [Caballeronia sp. LZ019]|uniref:site-specific integrase n=1 Tax=Caballeronia sp. LZ019 TaxID=3038555 RepID=UPI002863AFC0|nr:site-specific integrase [Caballeronia sp. LZ019]MDR5809101.1 site-specific integrase [Caballeronia sp. LZ019]
MDRNRARSQTRTEDTITKYLRRAHQILSRMAREMWLHEDAYPAPDDVIAYMERHASEWKWATFRQYQASIACRYDIEFERTQYPLFAKAAEQIRALSWANCKPESEVGQTSSRKRKGVPKRDYDALIAKLSNPAKGGDYSRRAALWLKAAVSTGLRPCEWREASLSVDGEELIVKNAKATNGRGTGLSRSVPVHPDDLEVVRAHLESLNALLATRLTFAQVHECCAGALRRACRSLWPNDSKRRYALYSARHQFAANAKAVKSQEEVAELLGHHSVRTARRHYARRRSAWAQFREAAKSMTKPGAAPVPANPEPIDDVRPFRPRL